MPRCCTSMVSRYQDSSPRAGPPPDWLPGVTPAASRSVTAASTGGARAGRQARVDSASRHKIPRTHGVSGAFPPAGPAAMFLIGILQPDRPSFGEPMTRTVATVEPATPTAVIDRISLVLDTFDGPGRLTLAQIVRRTGLPRSSAHRMLERLVQLRWLRRSGRDYELGMRLVELGSLAVHQDRLVRAAGPLLGELHRATGLVAHLAVLDGADVVYLEKLGDRTFPTRVGGRQPAHCTGVGKAILAYGDAEVDLRVRKTKYSISTSSQLAAEL